MIFYKPAGKKFTIRPALAAAAIMLSASFTAQYIYSQEKGLPEKTVGGIVFIKIPGGSFMMGSSNLSERPRHKVTLKSFWMSKYEMTQARYEAVMGDNPSHTKGLSLPVEGVVWHEANEFCRRFSAYYNVNVRLPTEAEWEYACRAGTTTKYYWGDEMDGDYCWYHGNSGERTHPVGKKKPNAWGLYDMSGNVEEYCSDWYAEDYYSRSPEMNPVGPRLKSYRVRRGGNCFGRADTLRSAYRNYNAFPRNRDYTIGFRLVME